jgi:hypothetical protein
MSFADRNRGLKAVKGAFLRRFFMLTDEEIARRLRLIVSVKTGCRQTENEVLEVGDHAVIVRSEGGGRAQRSISYDEIRNAGPHTTMNGVIVRVLAQILGMYRGDYE